MVKKLIVLIFLGLLAVGGSWGVLQYGLWLSNTDTNSITDITRDNGYGSQEGFVTIEHSQQKTPIGGISTLISAKVENKLDKIEGIYNKLGDDIAKLAKDELVSVDVSIDTQGSPESHLMFSPRIPGDYLNREYSNVVGLTVEMFERGYNFTVNVQPTSNGKYVTVVAETTGLEKGLDLNQRETVNLVASRLKLNPGDVFDITYQNVKRPSDGSLVPFAVRTIINNEAILEEATKIDYSKLATLTSTSGYPFKATSVKLTQGVGYKQAQLVIVIPEMSAEELKTLSNKYQDDTDWLTRVAPRAPYEIAFRFTENGVNVLTFPSYYI